MAWYYTTTDSTATGDYYYWNRYTIATTSASTSIPFWHPQTFTVYFSPYSQESSYNEIRRESPYNEIRRESPYNEIRRESPYNEIRQESPNHERQQESPNHERQQESPNHERQQEFLEQQKAKADAKERARILLLEYLDDRNKQRLSNEEPLEIPSKLFSDIIYHIPISYGKIKAYKESKIITELCISVKESELPLEDIILTKLLYLLHDEEHILRTANHSNIQENLLAKLN